MIIQWDEVDTQMWYVFDVYKTENKEIEPDEEPPRGTLWLKGRVNKDGEFPDDEIRSVGEKLVSLTANSITMLIYQQH